ncbi:MAG: thiosulfohydrolase SoxB [Gammaproteobacteria bacterium]|nr:thiosulfohydrolase SoxB [Gammaproteobacteria bacterium]
MISRRDFLQASVAATALMGASSVGNWNTLAATQAMNEKDILQFEDYGNVTLVHITDIHAQTKPIYFREPSINIGVGDVIGKPPHVTGQDFLKMFNMSPGTPEAYALTSQDFTALAKGYGKMGGLDRAATIVKSIRATRGDKMLMLDGGDTWQGSYVAQKTRGQDMVDIMNVLQPDAMVSHWEFTLGEDRVKEIIETLDFPFLGSNIFDDEWNEPAFESTRMVEKNGVKIAVVGQAFPYLPIANPRWMFPSLSFGIREDVLQENVTAAREDGADLVVLLSHNGFDVDRKLAGRLTGIDVILTAHTHDALPEPVLVGKTMLIASGSNGKFVSRLDLDVQNGEIKGFKYKLIPVFSDIIAPDPQMAKVINDSRKPYEAELSRVLGRTESLLYRRGNFNGTFDDLICQALLKEREADIALSPGFRWGPSLLPGQDITVEDLHNGTSMSYPSAYRSQMNGKLVKDILEDVADNLFNKDPYYQQGGDMVRVGGMGYTIDVNKEIGNRISEMTILKTGERVDPAKTYVVAGWASVNEDTKGPAIWDVVGDYLQREQSVVVEENKSVLVRGV